MQLSILTDFAIMGIKFNSDMNLDVLNNQPFEMLEHYSPWSAQIPDYLQNLNVMCFLPPFEIFSIPPHLKQRKGDKNYKSQETCQKDYLHQFVLTDSQAQKRYCSSQVVYEKVSVFSVKEQSYVDAYIPFSYCLISQQPYLLQQKSILSCIYDGWLNPKLRDRRRYMQLSLEQKQNIYQSRSEDSEQTTVLIAESLEFILSIIFSIPIELTITKPLQLIITPLEKINKQEQTTIFSMFNIQATVSDARFQLADVDYRIIFNRLSIKNILKIIQYLLLDKQIMLFTTHVTELSQICEALLSLIKPFQWRCLYIPYLPVQLLETFHATVPYIIGVHSDQKLKILKQVDKSDKIIVDLDENKVVGLNQEFPEYVMNSIERELKSLGFSINKIIDKIELFQVIQLKHTLMKHFMQLVNNCIHYFTYSEEESQYGQISEIFQIDQYIQLFPSEEYIFYNEFIRTMMFSRFIEDSYKILYQSEYLKQEPPVSSMNSQLAFFLKQIKRLNQKKFFNMVENKNLYSAMQIDFEARLKSWVIQQKDILQIECGDLFANYKKFGKQVVLPLTTIDKSLIMILPEVFQMKQKITIKHKNKTEYKYVQVSTASMIIQSMKIHNIELDVLSTGEENKFPLHWKNKSYSRIQSMDNSRIKNYNWEQPTFIIPYPQINQLGTLKPNKKIEQHLRNKSSSLINIKENIGTPKSKEIRQVWVSELKKLRIQQNLPLVRIDLFDKLFNDQPYTPTKTMTSMKLNNFSSSLSSNKKIFNSSLTSVQRFR